MEFPGRGDGRGEPGGGTPLPARWSHPPGGQVLAPFALICCLCRPGADGRARCSPARLLEPRHGIAPRPARATPGARRPAPRMAGRVRPSDHRAEVPPARPIDPTKERTSAVGRVPPAANDGAPGGRALQGPGNLRRHQRPPAAHFTTGHRTGPWVASTLAIAVAPREAGAPRSEVRSSEPAGGREERDGRGIKHRAHTPAPYRPASAPVAADGRLEGAPLCPGAPVARATREDGPGLPRDGQGSGGWHHAIPTLTRTWIPIAPPALPATLGRMHVLGPWPTVPHGRASLTSPPVDHRPTPVRGCDPG